jgi:hypothetical protein
MTPFSVALAVIALLALSGRAATNDIENAVLRFPEIAAWKFRPDVAAECANSLIQAGRDSAVDHLKELAGKKWESIEEQERANRSICFLCRLVFVEKSSSEFLRGPRLGALIGVPYESMSSETWPYLPFAITNEIPLSMTLGYSLGGFAERAGGYLNYCASNGVFRTTPYSLPTPTSASNALHQVMSSPAWRALKWKDSGLGWSYELDERYAKEMLWKQVDNIANNTVQRAGASRSAQEPSRTSGVAGPSLTFALAVE